MMPRKLYLMAVTDDDEVILKNVEGDTYVLPSEEVEGDADAHALKLAERLFGEKGRVDRRIEHKHEHREDWLAVIVRIKEPQQLPDAYGMFEYSEALSLTLPHPTLYIVNEFYADL